MDQWFDDIVSIPYSSGSPLRPGLGIDDKDIRIKFQSPIHREALLDPSCWRGSVTMMTRFNPLFIGKPS